MDNTETIKLYSNLLSDFWTFYLSYCGVLISVITLLYSFITNKRAELEIYAEQLKMGVKDPYIKRKQKLSADVIKRFTKINKRCIHIFCISLFLCLTSWLCLRFLSDSYFFCTICFVGLFSIINIILSGYLLFYLYKQYKIDTEL